MLAAACGDDSDSDDAAGSTSTSESQGSTTEAEQPPEPVEITIGWNGVTTNSIMPVLAQEAGLFPDHFDVKIEVVASTDLARLLSTGQLDVVYFSAPNLELAAAAGAPVAWLAGVQPFPDVVLIGHEEIETMEDFRGKPIAVSAPGTFGALMTTWALNEAGLSNDDVTIVPLGTAGAILASFTSGQVKGWATNSPTLQAALAAVPGSHELFDHYEEEVDWIGNGIGANTEWVADHPEATVELLEALQAAQELFFSDPEMTKSVIQKSIPNITPADVETSYEWVSGRMAKTLTAIEAGTVRNEIDFLIENGFPQMQQLTPDDLVLPDYLQEALGEG
ncbi:MAG: ABC transporter substrate-binding protein [Acidimicrobiia bacterium]